MSRSVHVRVLLFLSALALPVMPYDPKCIPGFIATPCKLQAVNYFSLFFSAADGCPLVMVEANPFTLPGHSGDDGVKRREHQDLALNSAKRYHRVIAKFSLPPCARGASGPKGRCT